jgi:formate/nitrite transporter FocA (FNT family)
LNGETEQESHLLEVGCIAVLCVGLTFVLAMLFTTAFPDVKVPPIVGFCGGGGFAVALFVVALLIHLRRGKPQASDDEGAS